MRTYGSHALLAAVLAAACGIAAAAEQAAHGDEDLNIWLIDRDGSSGRVARIAGTVHYGAYEAHATLGFQCGKGGGRVVPVELAFNAATVGFDTDPYEGPAATASAQLTFASGSSSPVKLGASGFYGVGGRFDTGTPFVFATRVSRESMRGGSAARGEPLHMTFPTAKGMFKAEFRWPADNAPLLKVIGPCLGEPVPAKGA